MRLACFLIAATVLAACGGGGGGSDPDPVTATPPPANNAPTISGKPPTQVVAGEAYAFTPDAADADGDTLTFTISNPPAWAVFDDRTGALTGTPAATDIGTTLGVTISVTDGTDSASLAPFDLEVQRIPVGSATVSWDIPTTNADGTMLSDLAGFVVYYGTESGVYPQSLPVNNPRANSAVIDDLALGSWYFAVTAIDETGNESALSTEVSKVVRP
jgi:hypothetical protein